MVSVERLNDLRESIEDNYRNGLIDKGVFEEYLKGFVYSPHESLPEARSIIVVAVRQPRVRFTFYHDGKPFHAIVPPSYLHALDTNNRIRDTLTEILATEGFRVAPARIPLKLLAVCSGLAEYGRNNITYVETMGSFHRLAAFYSDMPWEGDNEWYKPGTMDQCETCGICMDMCPTGALTPGQFVIHADKCIVFHNEHPADVPFPAWMDPSWHNCLVGCMLCQEHCPEDNDHLRFIEEGPAFTEEETRTILARTPLEKMPDTLVKKLKDSDLVSVLNEMPRNLNALLEKEK